jgi:hypothetical protein
MNSVIIICDDSRIELVKEAIQALLVTRVTVVSNFDAGISALFEKQPLVVFIQDDICGVKGDTVTCHVNSLFQTNSPQFVVLDRADHCPGLIRNLTDGINLNLTVEELVSLFRKHLMKVSGIRWLEPSFIDSNDDIIETISAVVPRVALSGEVPDLKPLVTPKECLFFPVREISSPDMTVPVSAEIAPPGAVSDHPATGVEAQREVLPAATRRSWPWVPHMLRVSGLMLLVCGVICVGCYSTLHDKDIPHAVSPSHSVSSVRAKPFPQRPLQLRTLPSFILLEWRDPTFGASRPGWERYCSMHREFFLHQEDGVIRVVQMVALTKKALTRTFVSAALRELSGSTDVKIGTRTVHDGYLVEHGYTLNKTEVDRYTLRSTGAIRGVIVILP